jgi:hypothetical protein
VREKIHRERNAALDAQLAHLGADDRATLERALPVLEQLAELLTAPRA